MRAVDNKGAEGIVAQTVVIGNRPPIASFSYLPTQPSSGQTVNFFSTASDPDSPIVSQAWDLDGNGSYNDASGPSIARAYGVGSQSCRCRYRQRGRLGVRVPDAERDHAAGPGCGHGHGVALPQPLPDRAHLRHDPRPWHPAAPFDGHCSAGLYCYRELSRQGLPVRGRPSRVVKSGADGSRRGTQVMRLSRFERHTLRSGTVIKLFITKANTIGKYTRFKIRSRKPPARLDRCLVGGNRKPVNCPTS